MSDGKIHVTKHKHIMLDMAERSGLFIGGLTKIYQQLTSDLCANFEK